MLYMGIRKIALIERKPHWNKRHSYFKNILILSSLAFRVNKVERSRKENLVILEVFRFLSNVFYSYIVGFS